MAFILLKKFNHDSLYSGHGPEEPLYYNYDVKQKLSIDIESIHSDTREYSSIILFTYRINTCGKFPFLEYILIVSN
jgi:hypothetical protein